MLGARRRRLLLGGCRGQCAAPLPRWLGRDLLSKLSIPAILRMQKPERWCDR